MQMENGIYTGYLPQIFIEDNFIPAIGLQDDLVYLGKRFNSNMCLEVAKTNVINKLHDLLAKITNIGIKPQSKIKLLKLMIYPKLSFELKIYDFPYTWITNSLDSIVHYHLRKWLEMPIRQLTCLH